MPKYLYLCCLKNYIAAMTISNAILRYAREINGDFKRKQLIDSLTVGDNKIPADSISVTLNMLVADGSIKRVGYGVYRLSPSKNEFSYPKDDKMSGLCGFIKEKFPFADFCVWKPSVLSQFMQHIPSVSFILVDVEREAMESVFHALQDFKTDSGVLLNPSAKEIEMYITGNEQIIVRPLVKEAPLYEIDECIFPTMEKMLVDAIGDKELAFMQGNELYTIFENVSDTFTINRSRMIRYASRRNRKEKVEQILKTIGL